MIYGQLSGDPIASPSGAQRVAVPVPAVRKSILLTSIMLCMMMSGRTLFLVAKVIFKAGMTVSGDLDYYTQGAARLKMWLQMSIHGLHIEGLEYGALVDDIVAEVEALGSIVTKNVLYTVMQSVVTFIFLLYMLWSPIKVDGNSTAKEVVKTTQRYLQVKFGISAFTGFCITIVLAAVGLDLPAAFGFLSFLANFLPGVGSLVASVLPCILAVIDVRKTPTQVFLALICQLVVHFCIDFVIEPVFFGISVEIHSVVVILNIYFFYQVWGVPGMLLSVPLLAVVRIVMKSMKQASLASASGNDAETIVFLDSILEGRWMSTVGDGEEDLEMVGVTGTMLDDSASPSGEHSEGASMAIYRHKDFWVAASENEVLRELRRFYQAHSMLIDAAGLCAILVLIVLL